jgi:hypothetical protein
MIQFETVGGHPILITKATKMNKAKEHISCNHVYFDNSYQQSWSNVELLGLSPLDAGLSWQLNADSSEIFKSEGALSPFFTSINGTVGVEEGKAPSSEM